MFGRKKRLSVKNLNTQPLVRSSKTYVRENVRHDVWSVNHQNAHKPFHFLFKNFNSISSQFQKRVFALTITHNFSMFPFSLVDIKICNTKICNTKEKERKTKATKLPRPDKTLIDFIWWPWPAFFVCPAIILFVFERNKRYSQWTSSLAFPQDNLRDNFTFFLRVLLFYSLHCTWAYFFHGELLRKWSKKFNFFSALLNLMVVKGDNWRCGRCELTSEYLSSPIELQARRVFKRFCFHFDWSDWLKAEKKFKCRKVAMV